MFSLSEPPLLPPPPQPPAAMARKTATGEELSACAKVNSYRRGAHRDKDSLRHQNEHVDKVKMAQNAALDRYVR